MKSLHPQYDPEAIEHAKVEGKEHLENLRIQGALGVTRPVRILATAAFPEGEGEVGKTLSHDEKRVHLIRHGQGFHNLLADVYRSMGKEFNSATGHGGSSNPYCHPAVVDPPLTELGRNQAKALQPLSRSLSPELIVVSPFVRATQTGLIAFAHLLDETSTKVPFVAHEACREITGVHTCDKRRSTSELRRDFPMVDYSIAKVAEDDPLWNATVRETPMQLSARAYDFMMWLRERPEQDIAVATHSAWLFALLNAALECDSAAMTQWFVTGELRSFIVRFEDSMETSSKRVKTSHPR